MFLVRHARRDLHGKEIRLDRVFLPSSLASRMKPFANGERREPRDPALDFFPVNPGAVSSFLPFLEIRKPRFSGETLAYRFLAALATDGSTTREDPR